MAASWRPWRWWRRWRKSAEVPQELEPWQAGDDGPAEVYARALLKRAEITEEYFVKQRISRNPLTEPDGSPVGRIELAVPYDGHRYFTRVAKDDVAHQAAPDAEPGGSAVVGHLLLRDFDATHLGEELDLAGRYGSIAIEVPLGNGAPGDLDQLSADRQICTATYDFKPDEAEVIPARLDVELFDPDSLSLPPTDLRIFDFDTDEARRRISDSIAKIVRHVSFTDELILQIVVNASLPDHAELGRPQPGVARVAIRWPTITSLDSLRLEIPKERPRRGVPLDLEPVPFRYNPVEGCVEWDEVRMFPTDETAEAPDTESGGPGKGEESGKGEDSAKAGESEKGEKSETPEKDKKLLAIEWPGGKEEPGKRGAEGGEKPKEKKQGKDPEKASEDKDLPGTGIIRRYRSMPMLLAIRHPGELYRQETLEITADVQVPGYLLSGMSARVYDATGYYLEKPLALTTKIHAAAELQLDDAFAMRDRSPSQHLFFDELIPDEIRITDIRTALEDRGFTVKKVWPREDGPQYNEEKETDSWLLVAHRKVGPDYRKRFRDDVLPNGNERFGDEVRLIDEEPPDGEERPDDNERPDDMILWVLAEGTHSGTDRDRVMPGGGVMHKTWLPSGELRIVIRGSLPGDSTGRLTYEMNVLHGMLWERYVRLRQRR